MPPPQPTIVLPKVVFKEPGFAVLFFSPKEVLVFKSLSVRVSLTKFKPLLRRPEGVIAIFLQDLPIGIKHNTYIAQVVGQIIFPLKRGILLHHYSATAGLYVLQFIIFINKAAKVICFACQLSGLFQRTLRILFVAILKQNFSNLL
jgi:hypothetical protein